MKKIVPNPSSNTHQESCTVLIVDDVPVNRQVTKIILEKNSFQTLQARNGRDAIEQYKANYPDIILMDLSMPKMGGLMAMQKIRVECSSDAYPIIAFTSGEHEDTPAELLQKGFSAYLKKPFKEKELVKALHPFVPQSYKKTATG